MNNVKQYEIWLAEVKFEQDHHEVKKRPVLILDSEEIYYVEVSQITSHELRDWDWFDYEITDYKACGLKKPSTIRLNKVVSLVERNLIHKIGELTRLDIINVEIILKRRKPRKNRKK